MKSISVEDAVGSILAHDITQYIAGNSKKVAFKRGHVVASDDIPTLLNIGKRNLYVEDSTSNGVHEDEAATRIATAACGRGVKAYSPHGGKVLVSSDCDGLLKIDVKGLEEVNGVDSVVLASIHTNQRVLKDNIVAAIRVVPLEIEDDVLKSVEKVCASHAPLIQVLPFKSLNVGIITTGSEIYEGRIQDGVGPVLKEKIGASGSKVARQILLPDSQERIVAEIDSMVDERLDLVIVTGGMSVDADDVTPKSIRACGARVVTYGVPLVPGAAFMLAYRNGVPILGVPGCVMYYKTTVFDVIFPRIQAGEVLERSDFIALAHGGLCTECEECTYPKCEFGK